VTLNIATLQMSGSNKDCTRLTVQTPNASSGKMLSITTHSNCCRGILQEIGLAVDVALAFGENLIDVLRHPALTHDAFSLR